MGGTREKAEQAAWPKINNNNNNNKKDIKGVRKHDELRTRTPYIKTISHMIG
jgi:hypothetical protein